MSIIPATSSMGNVVKTRRTGTLVAAHYDALLRRLQLTLSAGSSAVGVTSCSAYQGVSMVAANLAAAAANASRQSLLVDANPGSANVGKIFKTSAERGLLDFLSDEDSSFNFADAKDSMIVSSPIENLSLMLPGTTSSNGRQPSYDSQTVGELIDTLKHMFQFTVFDLPAANELTTCFSLASKLDGVILVMAPGKVSQTLGQRVVQQLRSAQCEILGVVWNE